MTPLISAEHLADAGPVRLLHVPTSDPAPEGLVQVPIDAWIAHARTTETGLDDLGFWENAFRTLGIGPDAITVVADDGDMTEAARVWFILQYFGLPAAVLDGGVTTLGAPIPQVPPYGGRLALRPGSGDVGLRGRSDLRSDLGTVQILDARTAAEYRGDDPKGNPRGGHLPGARNIGHADLLDGTRLKPAAEIATLLDAAGLDSDKPVVSHCNGGGRAALAALAAVLAGRTDVHVYYLSFADWAADESCPIQRVT